MIGSIRSTRRSVGLALAALVVCLGVTACGSDKESQQDAKQHLCSSLDAFAASVVSLQGLSLKGSSEEDVKAATGDVSNAFDQVVQDAKDVKTASTTEIESTWNDLKHAIEDRPKDQPVSQVIAGLEPKVAAFAQSWKSLAGTADCKTTS